jgi:hypothetical protein
MCPSGCLGETQLVDQQNLLFSTGSAEMADVVRLELGSLQVMHTVYHVKLLLGLNHFNEGIQRLVLDFVFVQEEDLHKHRVKSILEQIVVTVLAEHARNSLGGKSVDKARLKRKVYCSGKLLVVCLLLHVNCVLFWN